VRVWAHTQAECVVLVEEGGGAPQTLKWLLIQGTLKDAFQLLTTHTALFAKESWTTCA